MVEFYTNVCMCVCLCTLEHNMHNAIRYMSSVRTESMTLTQFKKQFYNIHAKSAQISSLTWGIPPVIHSRFVLIQTSATWSALDADMGWSIISLVSEDTFLLSSSNTAVEESAEDR